MSACRNTAGSLPCPQTSPPAPTAPSPPPSDPLPPTPQPLHQGSSLERLLVPRGGLRSHEAGAEEAGGAAAAGASSGSEGAGVMSYHLLLQLADRQCPGGDAAVWQAAESVQLAGVAHVGLLCVGAWGARQRRVVCLGFAGR